MAVPREGAVTPVTARANGSPHITGSAHTVLTAVSPGGRPAVTSDPTGRRRPPRPPVPSYHLGMPPDSKQAGVHCLVVDDDAEVRRAIRRVLDHLGLVALEAGGGEEALRLLEETGEIPLVVADVAMPGLDGLGLLREIHRRHPDTAVVMLSGVREADTAVACLQAGALDYITKPALVGEIGSRVTRALEKRDLLIQNRFYQRHLEQLVREQADRLRETFLEGVQALARALDARDPYTRGHSRRVAQYAVAVAAQLGYASQALEDVRLGGDLHDIGKLGVPEAVLHKPGPLSEEEFASITEHPVLGERILAPIARDNPVVLSVVRSHHERLDGCGFPDGLQGDRIPWAARVVAVADAFDAMTTDRSYRTPVTPAEAFRELRHHAGTHFDPEVVEAFLVAFPDPDRLPLPG